jgi:hypothetical protein
MIEGACHCGAVRWRLAQRPDNATACNCTTCRRYGALWAYGFENQDIHLSGQTKVYAWGRRKLGFHFCGQCGGLAAWLAIEAGADGRRFGAVNLRLAEPEEVGAVAVSHYDGLETGKVLPDDGRCIGEMWF